MADKDVPMADKDRPLDERGERDAPKMGRRLAERGAKLDLIVSSPALRALATAQLIAKALRYKLGDIALNDRLYASQADELLGVIHALDDTLKSVMLVGHNPEMSDLAHRFASEIIDMPTCAVAEFRVDAKSWSQVGQVLPDKASFDHPKKS
jgi:phosphohistidine phosphatase